MKIFLSYAKEDGAIVKEFHDHLKALGFEPWLDQEQLLPGQRWEKEIDRALNSAHVVILFLSPRSVQKRSFVTREANQAVQNLRYKKPDDIYIIPVLIEACDVPEEISERAQYIEISAPGAKNKIVSAIKIAAAQQGVTSSQGASYGPYQVVSRSFEETKIARPGHEISLEYPEFISAEHANVALALSSFFRGRATKILFENRSKPWEQSPDIFPEPAADDEFNHANGRWDKFSIQYASENFVSIYFNCSWYGAGAMHGHEFHEGFNFRVIDGDIYPLKLHDLFTDVNKAAQIISEETRRILADEYWKRCGGDINSDDFWKGSFLESTEPNLSNFEQFTVGKQKITFYFPPYSIASYAMGSFVIDVSFYNLKDVMEHGDQAPIPPELLN